MLDPLILESHMVVSHLIRMLGIEPRTCARAANACNRGAMAPASKQVLLLKGLPNYPWSLFVDLFAVLKIAFPSC